MKENNEHPENENKKVASVKKERILRILRAVFLAATVALGIWILFGVVKTVGSDSHISFSEAVRGASPLFCVVFIVVVLAVMVLDVAKFCIISKTVTGKFHVGMSAKVNFIGKYYDAVTPFATGGQPMQIYYLGSKGLGGGNASAITLIRYIFSILSWIVLGGAFMIAGSVYGVPDSVGGGNVLKIAGWVGIGVNLIVPTFVLLFLAFPRLMTKITLGVVKLGHKMKLVKDVDKTADRAIKVVNDFKSAFRSMAASPVNFIVLLLICFAEAALTFSVPYFVMKAFSCTVDGKLFAIITLNAFAAFGASFIPTPGNSGVMEGMGAIAFSVATDSVLVWSVLVWRFAVYYIYILIGFGITAYDAVRSHRRKKNAPPTQDDAGGEEHD